jgi:hypothetical protein
VVNVRASHVCEDSPYAVLGWPLWRGSVGKGEWGKPGTWGYAPGRIPSCRARILRGEGVNPKVCCDRGVTPRPAGVRRGCAGGSGGLGGVGGRSPSWGFFNLLKKSQPEGGGFRVLFKNAEEHKRSLSPSDKVCPGEPGWNLGEHWGLRPG